MAHPQEGDGSLLNPDNHLSPPRSTPGTPGGKGKKRVGFHVGSVSGSVGGDAAYDQEQSSPPEFDEDASRNSSVSTALPSFSVPRGLKNSSFDGLELTESLQKLKDDSTPTVLKSALRKGMGSRENRPQPLDLGGINDLDAKLAAEKRAHAKATGLERDVASAPGSRSGSPSRARTGRTLFGIDTSVPRAGSKTRGRDSPYKFIGSGLFHRPGVKTGQNTPDAEELEEYFPEPSKYRAGGLSMHLLLSGLWDSSGSTGHSRSSSVADSTPPSPGTLTPSFHITPPDGDTGTPPSPSKSRRFWPRNRSPRRSEFGIGNIVSASASSTALAGSDINAEFRSQAAKRPDYKRSSSAGSLSDLWNQPRKRKKSKDKEITIKKHVQETQIRRRYILKLCRALMEYGAPTHRLEAYLQMTSRVLEIEASFLYFPGTMIVSFDDAGTHTTEMKLVRVNQGVDLGRMKDTHNVYKDVAHDLIGVEEGLERLDAASRKGDRYPLWARILAFGFGSATVAPFAFSARLIDLPICFFLGLILGCMQLLVAPMSDLYTAIFEIAATIITSCLSRAFGSLRGGDLFCFSALAQSSIALILPGFVVLCAALELQSRAIVAGSVRLVYAVIYSFWIGYGVTIGTALYGAFDSNATSAATCQKPLINESRQWVFLFVPAYTLCLCIINNAKWRQMPMMIFISFAGYQVNYWSGLKFSSSPQITSTFGAGAISLLANAYSRSGPWIDERTARMEKHIPASIRVHLLRYGSRDDTEKPKEERRKSSIAESFLNLLPSPLRPRRDDEKLKDVEGNASSEEEEPEPKPSVVPEPTATAEQIKNAEANFDSKYPTDAQGRRIGRDGKPKRVNYVLAAAAMLPAIFVQVPSGVSVAGSLVSGIAAANSLTHNNNNMTTTMDGSNGKNASGVLTASDITNTSMSADAMVTLSNNASFNVAFSVVEVAIGITIGLFIGSIIVYPKGKGGTIGQGRKSSRTALAAF